MELTAEQCAGSFAGLLILAALALLFIRWMCSRHVG